MEIRGRVEGIRSGDTRERKGGRGKIGGEGGGGRGVEDAGVERVRGGKAYTHLMFALLTGI